MEPFAAWIRWASLFALLAVLILRPTDPGRGPRAIIEEDVAGLEDRVEIFIMNDFDTLAGHLHRLEDRVDKLQQDFDAAQHPLVR